MGSRRFSWGVLAAALLCLRPDLGGIALVMSDGGEAMGWALIGFFGAGVFVLGRKGLTGR